MHKTASRFWKCFDNLPLDTQIIANESFNLLKINPRHPSLHFKKVGNLWSARVGFYHRALAVEDDSDFIWFWIGNHDEYERLIKQLG